MQKPPTLRHRMTVVTIVRISEDFVLIVMCGVEARVVYVYWAFVGFFCIKSNISTSLFSRVILSDSYI